MNESLLSAWTPRALSVLRIVAALCFLQHGLTKFFGFPGPAPAHLAFFPGILGGLIEAIGGVLLLIGLFTRPAAFIMSGEMAVAYFYAHLPSGLAKAGAMGFFPYNNAGELAIMYCFVFLYLFFAGPGPWSIDAQRRLT